MSKTSAFIEEEFIKFYPSLAKLVGINSAIVLQQFRFLLANPDNGRMFEGERWIFNTYEQWQSKWFPFWSVDTIQRIFTNLEAQGFLLSCQPEGRASRRKHYRLNRGMVAQLTIEAANETDIETLEHGNLPCSDDRNLPSWEDRTLPSSFKTKNTSENTAKNDMEISRLELKARLWFNRRASTGFDSAEMKAIKTASKLQIPADDLALLDWWFLQEDHFSKFGTGPKKTVASLFNAIQGEIEKARSANQIVHHHHEEFHGSFL